jgi:general secretion pathway protein C
MATVAQTLRFDGELGSRLLARLPHLVAYLLVVLVGARVAWLLIKSTLPPATAPPGTVTPATPVRNVVDVPSILRANLFGQAPPAAGPDAPLTSMRLVLAGVVAASDEKLGLAMIGTAPNSIELKKVGDPLPGGARLHAVHVDRVLLDRGGSIESLPLPELATISFAPPPPTSTAAITVQRVEQAIRGNPSLIAQIMHRTPVISDGRLRGIRVTAGPNAAAFARLGLRNNDLVTAINGIELNDEAKSREIFDSLSGAGEARVTVERNGVQQELVLNLAEIASEAEQLAAQPAPEDPAGSLPGPDADSAR